MASVDTPDDQVMVVLYPDAETDEWGGKSQIGLSELGSRLNTKQHYDNRGRQVWADGVEEATVQWNTNLSAGASAARSTNAAWRGAASVLLTTPAVANSFAEVNKYFYSPRTGKYSVEVAWSIGLSGFVRLYLSLFIVHNGRQYIARIAINGKTRDIMYYDNVPAYVNTGHRITSQNDIHFWHKMKVVLDIQAGNYLRIMADGFEVDLTGVDMWDAGIVADDLILVNIRLEGDATGVYYAHLDDFILSHLEPD